MGTFSTALFLSFFAFSNSWARTFVALMSVLVVTLTIGCIWITWKSSNDGRMWRDGFQPSIARAVQDIRSSAFCAVRSIRHRLRSHASDDVGNVCASTGSHDRVGV
ncbi:hypothetical protein F5148DRAFT_1190737, partial [Russula earlei]